MSIRKGEKVLAGISESDLTQDDVIDSLSSTATTLPLSANQGKILDEKIDGLTGSDIAATDPQSLGFTNTQGFIDVASEKLVGLEDNFLTASKSVYVDATNGDDTTGDGSQEKPWKTIQKAVDECPSIGDKYIYYIYLEQGTYDESIIISDKHNICIYGATTLDDSDNFKVRSMRFLGVASFQVRGIYLYGSNETPSKIGLNAESTSGTVIYCKFSDCILRTLGNSEIMISNSNFSDYRSGNVTYGAIHASSGKINCYNISGSNNKCAYSTNNSGGGGQIFIVTNCTLIGDTMFDEGLNGRIHYGTSGYQLIGSVTGANSVAIDSELYTEFLVEQKTSGGSTITTILCSNQLADSEKNEYGGWYRNSSDSAAATIAYTKKYIKNSQLVIGGTDKISESTMTVYGKR